MRKVSRLRSHAGGVGCRLGGPDDLPPLAREQWHGENCTLHSIIAIIIIIIIIIIIVISSVISTIISSIIVSCNSSSNRGSMSIRALPVFAILPFSRHSGHHHHHHHHHHANLRNRCRNRRHRQSHCSHRGIVINSNIDTKRTSPTHSSPPVYVLHHSNHRLSS